jgi:hypothetical protein
VRRFAIVAEVQRESLAAFDIISVDDFRESFHQWKRRWDSFIHSRGRVLWRWQKFQICTNILNNILTIPGILGSPPPIYFRSQVSLFASTKGVSYVHFRTIFNKEQRSSKHPLKLPTCQLLTLRESFRTLITRPPASKYRTKLYSCFEHNRTFCYNSLIHRSVQVKAYFPGFLTLCIRIW